MRTWNSTIEIERELHITKKQTNRALNKTNYSKSGSQWRYSRDGSITMKIKPLYPVKVLQYGLDGKFLKSWNNIHQAGNKLKISKTSISQNIKGVLKSAGKFQWRFGTTDNIVSIKPSKIVSQLTLEGNLVKDWNSTSDIVNQLGLNGTYISNCLTNKREDAYGFKWMYK